MPGRAVMGAAGAARSRAGDNNTLMTPPRATPNETPREGESTTAVAWMGFEFEDVVEAVGRHAAVEVHIPWYVIDPQGHNIRNQRLRELAKRHLHEQTADSAQFQRSLKRANTNRNLQSARHLPAPPPPGQEAKGAKAEKVIHASDKMPFFARLTLFPTWDVIAAIALLFTVIVTPFEVGFLKAPETVADLDALFFINRVVDLVFIVDMGLQFFIIIYIYGAQESRGRRRRVGAGDGGHARLGDAPLGDRTPLRHRLVPDRHTLGRALYLRHTTAARPRGRLLGTGRKGAAHDPRSAAD